MSVPALTVIMLVVIELLLRLGNPADAMGFHSVDVWNLPPRIELCRQAQPDLALIGSSLLLVLNQDKRGTHFYSGVYPPYLQSLLRKATGETVTCINMCSGLQMVSEAYFITRAITDQRDYPPVIVYGISLRDFVHDQFALEWRCDSFASVAPFVPVSSDVIGIMTGDLARKEFILDHFWYLYRDRADFRTIFLGITKDFLEVLPLDQPFYRLGQDHAWRPQITGFLWETWVPRHQEKFTEAIFRTHPEFLKRFYTKMQEGIYMQGSQTTRAVQARYLEGLAALCRAKQVRLVIVNMPLGPESTKLVPPGLNNAFRDYLRGLSQQYGIAFLDLFEDPEFGSDSFKDTVHLNYHGAVKLAERLTSELKTKYPDVLSTIASHAESRALKPGSRLQREEPFDSRQ